MLTAHDQVVSSNWLEVAFLHLHVYLYWANEVQVPDMYLSFSALKIMLVG